MTTLLHHYQIVVKDKSVFRLRYHLNGETHESSLCTAEEVTRLIYCWQENTLLGSFGIGTRLSSRATFEIRSE